MDTRKPCGMDAELLQDYLDGALSRRDRDSVQAHLEGCPDCAREYEGFRRLAERLALLPLFSPAADFDRVVLGAVLPRERKVLGVTPLGWFGVAYLAFTLVLLGAAVVYFNPPVSADLGGYLKQLGWTCFHQAVQLAGTLATAMSAVRHVYGALTVLVLKLGIAARLVAEAARTYDGALYLALSAVTALAFFLFARRSTKGGPIVHAAL